MTDQLYRATVEPANIGLDERPLVLQEAIDLGALVPVEPDYEAAAKCLWYQERYTDFLDATPEEQNEYRRRARFVVDAGAGIGGDDE